jgi:hypothetical protein
MQLFIYHHIETGLTIMLLLCNYQYARRLQGSGGAKQTLTKAFRKLSLVWAFRDDKKLKIE